MKHPAKLATLGSWGRGSTLPRSVITSQGGAATLRSSHIFSKSCRGEAWFAKGVYEGGEFNGAN